MATCLSCSSTTYRVCSKLPVKELAQAIPPFIAIACSVASLVLARLHSRYVSQCTTIAVVVTLHSIVQYISDYKYIALETSITELKKIRQNLESTNQSLGIKVTELGTKLQLLETTTEHLQTTQEAFQTTQEKLEETQTQLQENQTQLEATKKDLQETSSKLTTAQEEAQSVITQLNALQQSITTNLSTQLSEQMQEQHTQAQTILNTIQARVVELNQKEQQLATQLLELQQLNGAFSTLMTGLTLQEEGAATKFRNLHFETEPIQAIQKSILDWSVSMSSLIEATLKGACSTVATQLERSSQKLQELEQAYQLRSNQLNQQITALTTQIDELKAVKEEFAELSPHKSPSYLRSPPNIKNSLDPQNDTPPTTPCALSYV